MSRKAKSQRWAAITPHGGLIIEVAASGVELEATRLQRLATLEAYFEGLREQRVDGRRGHGH